MNKGDATAGLLQRSMWKLLLAHIPRRCSTNHELTARFRLWSNGQFTTLLERIDEQTQTAPISFGSNPSQRAKRAKRMSQCCAHRKGIQSLRGEVARLTTEQQLIYAHLLLPDEPERTEPPLRKQKLDDLDNRADHDMDHEQDATPCQDLPSPMKGVKFARMTGPGPSGFRPEHLAAMLKSKRRRAVNRLLRAIGEAETMAANGTLPPAGWAWIMNSRLVYIAKKTGSVPRPIRVGEVWRRLISKHFLHRNETKVRKVMVDAAQFGVSMPGGAEALVHTRETIEATVRSDPAHGVWACINVAFRMLSRPSA